jgi:nucleotide-binding universal stress UspA family protein
MYEKVLVAVDHSPASGRALAAAGELAGLSKGEVWVLHVREREVIPRLGLVPTESDAEAEAATLADAGITAHAEMTDALFGRVAQEIVATATQHEVGVIVMGSRGRGDLAGLVLGSTAHKVIHLADGPVLIVR